MSYFDKSQKVAIVFTKVIVDGNFSHWEVDFAGREGEYSGTSPDFIGADSMVGEWLFEDKYGGWYRDGDVDYET